jgi:hypothetical protein
MQMDKILKTLQLLESQQSATVQEGWTDFVDARRAHEEAGSKVTGKAEDYVVTTKDGERRRYITKDGRRRVETLPPVAVKTTGADDQPRKRGRPRKVTDLTESEWKSLRRNIAVVEAKMSDEQRRHREDIVMSMKKDKDSLKKRYGDRWEEVMYATATKKALGEYKKSQRI